MVVEEKLDHTSKTHYNTHMSDFEIPSSAPKKARPSGQKTAVPPTLPTDRLDRTEDVLDSETSVDTEKPEYSKEDLLRIFDEIIFSGSYEFDYTIRGRLSVRFRTRTAEEINQIQKTVDTAGMNLISSVENMKAIMNLQYALVNYHGKDLSVVKAEDKAKFVEKLPGPIVGLLLNTLGKFDNMVALACQEGESNF